MIEEISWNAHNHKSWEQKHYMDHYRDAWYEIYGWNSYAGTTPLIVRI